MTQMPASACLLRTLPAALFLFFAVSARAAELESSEGLANHLFGSSVSLSGGTVLTGAYRVNNGAKTLQGAVYLFRDVDTATGTVNQDAKLMSSDGAASDYFGYTVSLSGTTGLVGAYLAENGAIANQGAAYLFRNLDTATGTITENVKLLASDGAAADQFGTSLSLSGSNALVGASWADIGVNSDQGAAYFFRNIDTNVTGTIIESVKLIASDGATNAKFGGAANLLGSTALVGSVGDSGGLGAAYLFRIASDATGTITENAKLVASDGVAGDNFGNSVSLSGSHALVGAQNTDFGTTADRGAAYFFRNATSAQGLITESVKLTASDGVANDYFGSSVSLSGSFAIVGARSEDSTFNNQGAAYLFHIAADAPGVITENVKLTASNAAAGDSFGFSSSLDGDTFVIGAVLGDGVVANSGKGYTGSVSSLTTLDGGHTSRVIDGISFVARGHWIIGQTTSGNQVTLTAGDSADITALGKAVYIGQSAGADQNTLILAGTLTAHDVYIGSLDGNVGNRLQIEEAGIFAPIAFHLAPQNYLTLKGDYLDIADLLAYLGPSTLQVWGDSQWTTVDSVNYTGLISLTSDSGNPGYTLITTVPEPGAAALLVGAVLLLFSSRNLRAGKRFQS